MVPVKVGKKSIGYLRGQVDSIINYFACRVNYRIARNFLKEHPQPALSISEKKDIDRFWGGI